VERREENNNAKRIMKAEVNGKRSRERQKQRGMDVVQQDFKHLKFNVNITEDLAEWRRRTRVAEPSPQGYTA